MTTQTSINTVLGPIAPDALGFTLMHEHVLVAASGLYQSYPDLLGRGPEARAIEALKRAKAAGIDTIVDATTFDLGRHAPLLAAVSKASGVNIVNVTGWWLEVPRFLQGVGVVTSRHKSARGSRHIPARAAVAEKRPEGVAFSRSFCRRFRGPIGDLLRCRSDLWIAVGRAVEFEAV